uniref:Vacuolar protein sorting-associated protein 37B-like n=1 Tax=Phallusia mammillata TaxID=59560 RepID=A0A6F9DXA9_9ASCI|nr:vacuolar protein sorting-associated protein 37B-like [Phallusia mammillata]
MSQWSYQYPNPGQNVPKDEIDFTTLLEDASMEELQELMDNEDKINEIVMDNEKIKKLKLDRELIQAENRSIADHNITREPKLKELREELALKYEQLKELNDNFNTNQAKLDSLHKDVNLETMLAVLQTTCAETEEQSEKLAEDFCEGELQLAEFMSTFKAKRTLAHMRRIKTDKMRELVLDVQRNPPVSSTVSPPPVPGRIPNSQQNMYPYPSHFSPGPTQNRFPPNAYSSGNQQLPYKWS